MSFVTTWPASANQQSFALLDDEQKSRLNEVYNKPLVFHSKSSNCSPINTNLRLILEELLAKYRELGVPIIGVLLVGGAASHVANPLYNFTDLDVVFLVKPHRPFTKKEEDETFATIQFVVTNMVRHLMARENLDTGNEKLQKSFLAKQFRFNPLKGTATTDSWSLFSFNNKEGMNLEFKFVLRMARDYQFASDSLKIDLLALTRSNPDIKMTSSFGSIRIALRLIDCCEIDTNEPEKIHGGGFLKYILLKYKGFNDARDGHDFLVLIESMLDGFLALWKKDRFLLTKFLSNHFNPGDVAGKTRYLDILEGLVVYIRNYDHKYQVKDKIEEIRNTILQNNGFGGPRANGYARFNSAPI